MVRIFPVFIVLVLVICFTGCAGITTHVDSLWIDKQSTIKHK